MHAISLPELISRGDSFVPIEQRTAPSEEAILTGIYTPPVLAQVAGAISGAPSAPTSGPVSGPASGDFSGEAVVLWGTETVRRAHAAGAQTLNCEELGSLSVADAIKTVLTVENRPGAYSLGELVEVIGLLERFGLSPTERIRELVDGKKRGLLAQAERTHALPAAVLARVIGGEVSLRHGEQLAELPAAVRAALEAHLGEGSFSSRRELLAMTWESWKRFKEDDPTIEERLIEALSSSEPREPLRRVRYPSYADARSELDRFRSSYIVGSGLKLEEPPNFEGDQFTLLLPFRSEDDLRRKVEYLLTRVLPVAGEITDLLG